MSKGSKSYKNQDRTSGGIARHLDDLRERNKKRAEARKKRFERSSLSRGGFS